MSHSEKVKAQIRFVFSVLNIFATTAITKSSMKPWNGATKNRHVRSNGERNGEQRRTKVSFGWTMMQALELLWLAKRHILEQSDVNSEEIKLIALAVIELCLKVSVSQIDRYLDSQIVSQ